MPKPPNRGDQLIAVNKHTGEEIPLRITLAKPRGAFKEFALMDTTNQAQNLVDLVTKGTTLRVLFTLMTTVGWNNQLLVNQTEIAKRRNMRRNDVNAAIKELVTKGVLIPGPKAGPLRYYALRPDIAWRGDPKEHKLQLNKLNYRAPQTERDPNAIDFVNDEK